MLINMTDFNSLIDLNKDIVTTYKQKELVLLRPYLYDGPITLQYLPYGGIQSTFNYHLIINTKNGFIAIDELIYDNKKMSSKEFITTHENLINTILPN